jgi:replicative DNA helicase
MDDKKKESLARLRKVAAKSLNLSTEYGKVPPQAVELEEAVLGALMLEKEAVNDTLDILHPEHFYKDAHQQIFEAITYLFQNNQPVDILTVTQRLKQTGHLELVGGPFYIAQLTNRVASTANAEFHARIIAQKYVLRELIRISNQNIKNAFDETTDALELLNEAEKDLYSLAEGNLKKGTLDVRYLVHDAIKHIEEISKKEGGISGVETGFSDLDEVTSGFQPSDMIILAARPGMGKTAFVLSMARNTAVMFKKGVAVFSLEMSSIQLVNRLISSETGLNQEKLRKGQLTESEWVQLNTKVKALSEAPIFIDDTPALSVYELRAKCRRLKSQYDIQLIVIDYLQLMTAGKGEGNRQEEIAQISRSIKSIAKELHIPIIALSQLNRTVETRTSSKRPQLSDLRESGAIEQDADMVMFLYRPEYYGLDEASGNTDPGFTELIIQKHRNGSLATVNLRFHGETTRFVGIHDDVSFGLSEITVGSKMNDMDEEALGSDMPF